MGASARPRRFAALVVSLSACALPAGAHGDERPSAHATPHVASGPAAIAEPAAESGSAPCRGAAGAAPPAFRWPAPGAVTSPFGRRAGQAHEGIDISASRYDLAVFAAAAGTVTFSDTRPGYGRVIVLRHEGGFETVYAHNQDNLAVPGTRVAKGEVIADMGSTGRVSGPHLHFEVRIDGRPVDPLQCLPPRAR